MSAFYEEADGENVVKNNVNPGIHMIDNCDYDKKGVGFSTGYAFSESSKLSVFYNFFNDRYTRGRPYVGGDWDYYLGGFIFDQKIGQQLNLRAYAAYRVDDYLHLYDKGGTRSLDVILFDIWSKTVFICYGRCQSLHLHKWC